MLNWRRDTYFLLGFVLLKFGLQYALIHPAYDLQRDEYLHLDQANHLAWGFISIPPVTSIIALWIKWLGGGMFWVKFFPALSGALVIILTWKLVEKLGGDLYAKIIAASALLFSVLTRINILFQPNSLDVLCWTVAFYIIVRYIQSEKPGWLIALGIVLGLGFLNKYNMVFLILGILPAMLLTPYRRLFLDRYFYLSLLIFLLIISPNLYWQFRNGLPVVHHMQDLSQTQLVHVSRTDFLKEQLLFFIGSFYLIVLGLFAMFRKTEFRNFRLIAFSYCLTMVLFLYLHAKGYYAIGLYPVLIAFGSVYLARILDARPWRLLRFVLPLANIILFVLLADVAFPVLKPDELLRKKEKLERLDLVTWNDGSRHELPQDFADMLGWRELANKVDQAYVQLNTPANTLVLCYNYGQAGAINYYSRLKGIGAFAFNADYINWFPEKDMIRHIILVRTRDEAIDTASYNKLFGSVTLADSINNPKAVEYGTQIYILKEARSDIRSVMKKNIRQRIATRDYF